MRTAIAVFLLSVVTPSGAPVDVLPLAQIAPGNLPAADVLAGRAHFEALGAQGVPVSAWIRLKLDLSAGASHTWVLFFPISVDRAQAYVPSRNGYRAEEVGTSLPFAARPHQYLRPAIQFDDRALNGRPIYLHVHYYPDSPFYLRLSTLNEAVNTGFQARLVQGLFFGVLLAIGLCNLYVALAVRERSAAYFVVYVVALALNELAATGMGAQYLWPNAAPDVRLLTLFTNTLAFLTGLLFTRSFLQTRIAAPFWDRMLIGWFLLEAALDTLRHVLPNGLALAAPLLAVQFAGMLITMAAGIVRIRQGFGPARFFVLAFAPAIAGYMANLVYDIYIPPGNWFLASNGVEFGAMFESIIFSFSLLDRIRTLDAANVRLRALATRDHLTGLYNRTAFFERFALEIASARESGQGVGVLYIDLDGFKAVNDRYGHRTGDLLLQIVARRLRTAVRDSDTIARLGGDEFAVLVTAVGAPAVLEAVRSEVVRMSDTPLTIEGKSVVIGITAGAALYPRDGDAPDQLMEAADRAMYAAKQARAQALAAGESTTST